MDIQQQIYNRLTERLDCSPTVNRGVNGSVNIVNEQFNSQQMFIIHNVIREFNLQSEITFTDKRPHPAIVITLFDHNRRANPGEKQKDWDSHHNSLM